MREILFKSKRVDNDKWVEGYFFKSWKHAYILWGTTNDIPNMVEVDPDTLCQDTGLTDENGTKIFEGDIVEAGYYKWKCQVVWDKECARFICHTTEKEYKFVYVDMVDKNDISVLEVIGNIHDKEEQPCQIGNKTQ